MLYTQKKVSNNRNPRRSYVRVGVRIPAWIGLQNYNIYLEYANSILQFIEIGVFLHNFCQFVHLPRKNARIGCRGR